jgi:hypothetical protein
MTDTAQKRIGVLLGILVALIAVAAALGLPLPGQVATKAEVQLLDTRNSKDHEDITESVRTLKATIDRTDRNVESIRCWIATPSKNRGACLLPKP